MNFINSIQTVDTHTVGQVTRIITSGVPTLKGTTMSEKKQYLARHFDYIRRITMLEPRGHTDMFGAVLTEPTCQQADMGMIFIDGENYLNMCGHGTMGVATALIETGLVPVEEPITKMVLEAPAGLIDVSVAVENKCAKEVTFRNVPAFVYEQDVKVNIPDIGEVTFDICFGGSFFAIVKDQELGVEISTAQVDRTVPIAVKFLHYLIDNVPVHHPDLPINKIELVEIYGAPKSDDADCQNMVVLATGQVDRSPCGTGTCAKLALLYKKGELSIDEEFVHESIIQTKFTGKIVETTKVGEYDAVIPQITGQAYLTGFSNFLVDDEDPVKYGFVLNDYKNA